MSETGSNWTSIGDLETISRSVYDVWVVSSDYRPICLSNNPALELEDVGNQDRGLAEVHARRVHDRCDIVLGRYSYPLIALGCLGDESWRTARRPCAHRDPEWIDIGWLRVLLIAYDAHAEDPELVTRVVRSAARCWPAARLEQLRPLVEEQPREH